MATEQQLIEGLRRADAAGDRAAAEAIARELGRVRTEGRTRPTSHLQGVAEGLSPAARNMDNLADAINPAMWAAKAIANLTGRRIPSGSDLYRERQKAFARSPNRGSTAGRIAGTVASILPTMWLPGGPVAQGVAGGLLASEADDAEGFAKDAALGGVGGKVGAVVGGKVIAPVAERLGRTRVARKAAEVVVNRLNQARDALPARVRPGPVSTLPNPTTTPADRAVVRNAPDTATLRKNLEDAARLKMPYSLADADARLRLVAGSATRRSPDARMLAEETLGPRSLGQAGRAVNAIDEHLAPITDIKQRAADIRRAAQTASEPHYTAAASRAAPVDPELDAMIQTPAGKEALRSAYRLAQNEGRDPLSIGFDLDDQGQVILRQAPSFETLQFTKRGLDAQLAPYRNPITGKLDLEGNPEAQSVAGLARRFNERLGALNEDYAAGNAAYADIIRRRDALNLGHDLAKGAVPQRQFDAALGRMDDVTLPEVQRGYATAMADEARRMRQGGNPYSAVHGSIDEQAKIAALFPDGANDFSRIHQLERDMAETAKEVIGGSPTASRIGADKAFDDSAAVDFAVDAMGGGGVLSPSTAVRMGSKVLGRLQDARRAWKASEIAPSLLDPNPQTGLQFLDDLVRKQAEAETRRRAYATAGELLGRSLGVGVAPLLR